MRVVLAVNALGMGGTEKAVQTHALAFDRDRFEISVVAVREDGVRRRTLEQAGIEVSCADGEPARLAQLFAGADLVHVTRAGVSESIVPQACRTAGVSLRVESNVFGAVDASADEAEFDCHLFPSRMCALRYRRRRALAGSGFHDRHRVSHWPVDVARLRELAPDRAEAKRRLGLDPDRPTVIRVGRENDRKWRNLLVDMIPGLLRLQPEAQVVLVGPTPAKLRRLHALGVLDRVHLRAPTVVESELVRLYAAADVFITAAEIGESHSFAIEEAMALGAPVVTCSTPWVDNAQIEQVDNGLTGYVADHPEAFAEAVATLLGDDALRERFGRAAAAKADSDYAAVPLTEQLQRLYESLAAEGKPPSAWRPPPAEVDAFEREYERRLGEGFRPLTPGELREVEIERRWERARWALRAAGHSLNPDGLRYAAGVVRARLPGGSG